MIHILLVQLALKSIAGYAQTSEVQATSSVRPAASTSTLLSTQNTDDSTPPQPLQLRRLLLPVRKSQTVTYQLPQLLHHRSYRLRQSRSISIFPTIFVATGLLLFIGLDLFRKIVNTSGINE
jgi:hypothetical protein